MRRLTTLFLASFVVACAKKDAPPPADSAVILADVQPAQFAKLAWIQGGWQGEHQGKPFFESYRLSGDTTIDVYHHSSAAMNDTTERSTVRLRGGMIVHRSGSEWYASALTDTSIAFEPSDPKVNAFTWARAGEDEWVATLDPRNGGSQTVYHMKRISK